MTHDISEIYDMVNTAMMMVDEEPFLREKHESDQAELKSLISRYVARLRVRQPKYAILPDDALPDAVLFTLRQSLSVAV